MTLLLPPTGASEREVSTAINQALKGYLNSTGTVTLNAGATTTTVANAFVNSNSVILFAPQTANASAIALPYVKPADITGKTGFIITHTNNANADKTFAYAILGN